MTLWIVLAVVAAVALWAVLAYNRLVRLRNEGDQAFSSIEVQLKRRADLVPNLVETVKGYAAHEQAVLASVTEARAKTLGARGFGEVKSADQAMTAAISGIFGIAEAYPQLRAAESFVELQRELTDTEDKVAAARRYYNSVVQRYNTARQSLPTNLIAARFGFHERDYYTIEDPIEREPVRVDL